MQSILDLIISETRKKFIIDSGWLFFERLLRLLTNFFIVVFIARELGPIQFGEYSYYLSLILILGVFTNLGLDFFVVGELIKNKNNTNKILGTVFYAKLYISLTVTLILLIVKILLGLDILLFIFSLLLIFKSFNWLEHYFQSKNENKYFTIASTYSLIIITSLNILGLYFSFGVDFFALVFTLDFLLIYIILYSNFKKHYSISLRDLSFDKSLFLNYIGKSWPLILIGAASIINLRLDQVFIGNLLDNDILGNYSASSKLAEAWLVIPAVLSITVFPIISKIRVDNYLRFKQLINYSIYLFGFIGIFFCIIVSINSDLIIKLLFGLKYSYAGSYLKLYIWTGLPYFTFFAFGHLIFTEDIIKKSIIVPISLIITNIILNFLLIPNFGAFGGIYATIVSTIISYCFLFFVVLKYTKFFK